VDCEQFRSALIDGQPALHEHAGTCPSCAALLVATAPANGGAAPVRALRLGAAHPRLGRALLAVAAAVALGVLGGRALQPHAPAPVEPAPEATPVASASASDMGDLFADPSEDDLGDDSLSLPTDLLASAVPQRSPR